MKNIYLFSLQDFQKLIEDYILGKYIDINNIFHGKTIFLKKLTLSETNKPLVKLIYHENTVNYNELKFWKIFLSKKINCNLLTEVHINYKFNNLIDMNYLFTDNSFSKPYFDINSNTEIMYIWFGKNKTFNY